MDRCSNCHEEYNIEPNGDHNHKCDPYSLGTSSEENHNEGMHRNGQCCLSHPGLAYLLDDTLCCAEGAALHNTIIEPLDPQDLAYAILACGLLAMYKSSGDLKNRHPFGGGFRILCNTFLMIMQNNTRTAVAEMKPDSTATSSPIVSPRLRNVRHSVFGGSRH